MARRLLAARWDAATSRPSPSLERSLAVMMQRVAPYCRFWFLQLLAWVWFTAGFADMVVATGRVGVGLQLVAVGMLAIMAASILAARCDVCGLPVTYRRVSILGKQVWLAGRGQRTCARCGTDLTVPQR